MAGWLSLCLISLSTVLALLFLKLSSRKNKSKKKLPPGPWTLPIIGSLHRVVSALPHRTMTELSRRHGPLMFLRLGEVPTVVVSNAEAAALVMKTNDRAFASRPCSATQDIFGCGGKGIAFAPYSDHWRQMRKICVTELLNSKQVRRMEGVRAEEAGNLVRSITASAGATVNVSEKVRALSNDVVCRAVFGGKFARQDEYLRELDEAFALVGGFCLVDLFPSSRLVRWLSNGERRMRTSYGRIQRIIAGIIDERKDTRAAGEMNYMYDLIRYTFLTGMTTSNVWTDMFAAATHTTSTVLEWAMSELMNNPGAMAKAQLEVREVVGQHGAVITNNVLGDLHYMQMVIKEVLRLHPPGPLVPRMTREDCTIMGYDMFKGTNVYVNVFAISRDPRSWENPEEFKPERFENNNINYNGTYSEFIPFGAGRRQCPGMLFGTSTVNITLAYLLYHLEWMFPIGTNLDTFDMSEKFGLACCYHEERAGSAVPVVCMAATTSPWIEGSHANVHGSGAPETVLPASLDGVEELGA
uniref:Putative Cytochrome P450 71D11 n=1 Tax=Aegilops tauschii TaxID=37682 RepID=M8CDV7_AEGTA